MPGPERFSDFITLERMGRTISVCFNHGDTINALSAKALRELKEVAQYLREDMESSVIVLSGQSTGFSAGFDLNDEEQANWEKSNLLEWRNNLRLGPDMCDAWENLEQVTICAIEKFCIGGGMALSLACDIRVMASDAYFRLPEVSLGMNMSWHSNPRLVSLVGPARAKQITILGDNIAAKEALSWGLAQEISPPEKSLSTALNLARRYAALPPLPVRMTKQSIDMAAKALHPATTYMDRDQFMITAQSEDLKEAIEAMKSKRAGIFTGR